MAKMTKRQSGLYLDFVGEGKTTEASETQVHPKYCAGALRIKEVTLCLVRTAAEYPVAILDIRIFWPFLNNGATWLIHVNVCTQVIGCYTENKINLADVAFYVGIVRNAFTYPAKESLSIVFKFHLLTSSQGAGLLRCEAPVHMFEKGIR